MLEIENLAISFTHPLGLFKKRKIPLLSGLSLSVAAGEIMALIGASGAGKSLLAHAVLGLLPPEAEVTGEIRLLGRSLLPYPKDLRDKTALIAQDIGHLDPLVRVRDHIAWAAERAGRSADVAQWLARLGLGAEVGALYPAQLSGGMARRVMAIMALVRKPALLVLDEPTAGLDPESRALLLGLLRDHVAVGGAALIISHDLMAVLPLAHRVALLHEGRLCAIEAAAHFTGRGEGLQNDLARAFWLALPENGFDPDA